MNGSDITYLRQLVENYWANKYSFEDEYMVRLCRWRYRTALNCLFLKMRISKACRPVACAVWVNPTEDEWGNSPLNFRTIQTLRILATLHRHSRTVLGNTVSDLPGIGKDMFSLRTVRWLYANVKRKQTLTETTDSRQMSSSLQCKWCK